MTIDILIGDEIDENLPVESKKLEKYAGRILADNGIAEGEYNIVFIGDQYMAELNRLYKNRPGTTDVLTFNLGNDQPEGACGEIYISFDKAREQAKELDVPFGQEVVRLVTHGLLHLSGMVHDTDEKYTSMTEKTEKLVNNFFSSGIVN